MGAAQLGTPVDRRLPVNNLGSSGQDGVEVQLSSSEGGGVSVEMEPFLSTPGAAMRIRPRGWDGLIYGNHRMISNGDGTVTLTFDYKNHPLIPSLPLLSKLYPSTITAKSVAQVNP